MNLSAKDNGMYQSYTKLASLGSKTLLQNPAFGPSQIRELTEVFVEKAIQVCQPYIGFDRHALNYHTSSSEISGAPKLQSKVVLDA